MKRNEIKLMNLKKKKKTTMNDRKSEMTVCISNYMDVALILSEFRRCTMICCCRWILNGICTKWKLSVAIKNCRDIPKSSLHNWKQHKSMAKLLLLSAEITARHWCHFEFLLGFPEKKTLRSVLKQAKFFIQTKYNLFSKWNNIWNKCLLRLDFFLSFFNYFIWTSKNITEYGVRMCFTKRFQSNPKWYWYNDIKYEKFRRLFF